MSNWLSLPDVLDENEKRIDDEMQRLFPTAEYGYTCEKCEAEFATYNRLQGHVRRGLHR